MRTRVVETAKDRLELADEAGLGPISIVSVLAGVLVAYGSFVILAAIAGGIVAALGTDWATDLSSNWQELGTAGGLIGAGCLFLAYVAGGYVAGRMARRAGVANGFLTFLLGLGIVIGVGAVVSMQAGTEEIVDQLRTLGVPTRWNEWQDVGTIAGIASVAAILLGSLLGGALGDRWHGKLVTRAAVATSVPARDVDLREQDRDVHSGDHFKHDEIVAGERRTGTDTKGSTLDEDRARARSGR
jgi:hypothetical protein